MFIQTEETPNPQTLKFIPENPVLTEDLGVKSLEFKRNQDASASPLAKRLLLVEGIEGVFLVLITFPSPSKNRLIGMF